MTLQKDRTERIVFYYDLRHIRHKYHVV